MSNTLLKDFLPVYTITPGYTIRRWVPTVETYSRAWWGYDAYGVKKYAHTMLDMDDNALPSIGDEMLYLTGSSPAFGITTVVGFDDILETYIPGHWSYDVVPDQYALTFSNNYGWNAASRSTDGLIGNGKAYFSVPIGVSGVVCGLNQEITSTGVNYFEIPYGIYCSRGTFNVIENGVIKSGPYSYVSTDVLSITRIGSVIYYAKNNAVVYRSAAPVSGYLLLDTSLYSAGDSITDAGFSATVTLTGYAEVSASLAPLEVFCGDGNVCRVVVSLAPLTASLTSPVVAGAIVSLEPLDVLATSGWMYYTEVTASLAPMTCFSSSAAEALVPPLPTTMVAAIAPLEVTSHALSGGNTLPSVQSLAPLEVFASNKPYTQVIEPLAPLRYVAGNFPDLGSYALLPFITASLEATGFDVDLNSAAIPFTAFTAEAAGGANADMAAPSFSFSGTGTLLERGGANVAFATFTLSATGLGFGNGNADLGFISSTLTALGGGKAAGSFPSFTLSASGTKPNSGEAALRFLSFSLSGTGTKNNTGAGAFAFVTFDMPRATAALSFPTLSLTATGSPSVGNAIAYVMNVHSTESWKYSNFGFMHIINVGGKPYGVKSDGLYLLEGSTDAGTTINGTITTKTTDFGAFNSKRVPYVYLNSDTDTTVTPTVDDVVSGTAFPTTFSGRKAKIARGLEGRYWSFKIQNIKQLEGLELLPEVLQRRVK